MQKLSWNWFDHKSTVPVWLKAEVGQIAIEWSMLEREFEELIRLLMDVDIRAGRIATTGMNLRTRAIVAANHLQAYVYSSKLDYKLLTEFDDLRERITQKLEPERNKVIHGLWDRQNGQWRVLRNSASRPVPILQPKIKKLARAVVPQSEPMDRKKLEAITLKIATASHDVHAFQKRLEAALAPLRNKSPVYTRRRPKRLAHSTATP